MTLAVLAGRLLGLPAGERAAVITVTAAFYGTRMSLLVLTCWGAVALAWAIAGPRPGSRGQAAAGRRRPGGARRTAAADRRRAAGPVRRTDIAAARDDGPLARFAGALVRGQLVPLPPAVAGLTATVLLATLGLRDLAGLVLLTPVAAMLLAAPGSAHPHDGPLDWLTPLVIQAGQYVYLAALGFRQRRSRPVDLRADRTRRPPPAGRRLPGPISDAGGRSARRDRLGRPDAGGRGGRHARRGHLLLPGPDRVPDLAAVLGQPGQLAGGAGPPAEVSGGPVWAAVLPGCHRSAEGAEG